MHRSTLTPSPRPVALHSSRVLSGHRPLQKGFKHLNPLHKIALYGAGDPRVNHFYRKKLRKINTPQPTKEFIPAIKRRPKKNSQVKYKNTGGYDQARDPQAALSKRTQGRIATHRPPPGISE